MWAQVDSRTGAPTFEFLPYSPELGYAKTCVWVDSDSDELIELVDWTEQDGDNWFFVELPLEEGENVDWHYEEWYPECDPSDEWTFREYAEVEEEVQPVIITRKYRKYDSDLPPSDDLFPPVPQRCSAVGNSIPDFETPDIEPIEEGVELCWPTRIQAPLLPDEYEFITSKLLDKPMQSGHEYVSCKLTS